MNLLYVLTTYPPSMGGAQLHQHLLAQTLSSHNTIQVITQWDENRTDWLLGTTLRAPTNSKDYEADGVSVHRIGLKPADKLACAPFIPIYYPLMNLALPPIAACLQRYIDPYAQRADLIHNVRIGREGISYAAYGAAQKRNIPFVLTPVHHPRWKGWRYQAYNRLYRLADVIIALTASEKRTLIELGVNADRIHIVGHGPVLAVNANPQNFIDRYHVRKPFILFIGQHYAYKGYRELLQAAPLVWKHIPEAQFVFIGPAVNNSESVYDAFKDPRIHRLGSVDLQTKTDALAACSIFCMPSVQESFGGVFTEAWSFGKPVIGCNIPAVSEVIENGVDGYLVEQKPADIAEKIHTLLVNSTLAKSLGLAGQHKLIEKFSWQKIGQRVEDAYSMALQRQH